MKPIHFVLMVLVALLLPAWMWLKSASTGFSSTERSLHALNEFTLTQNGLHRDLLSARAGMLRNYDPLVKQMAAMQVAVDQLHAINEKDPPLAAAVRRLDQLARSQEPLIEQFKSQNALLQNSLAYFSLFSTRLGDTQGDTTLRANALATAMLRLTLDTSAAAVADVDAQLSALSADPAAEQAPGMQALLAHARLLRELLPKADGVLKALFSLTSDVPIEDVRLLLMQRQQQAERWAQNVRYVLYATSLVLVGLLIWTGRNLQARSRALRRRAAIEHVLADMSTRLISSKSSDIALLIERGLANVAGCWKADRAYFVTTSPHARIYKWSRDGVSFPAKWPDTALDDKPSDVRSWLNARSPGEPSNALLGLDFLRHDVDDSAGESGLLRMALDAITNAVERDYLERDRARLEAHLQQARRMETIGALASGIAHNFNNIIGAILGFAETAQARAHAESRTSEDLGEIQRAGDRARNLVGQLLTFGRRSSIERTPTDLKALVAESRVLLQASLPRDVQVVVREPTATVAVIGEPTQLQQVIFNVCNNAAQAMDLRGVVEIALDVREIWDAARLDVGELTSGRYSVISISDSGKGMDAALRGRIFEPFFTTRKMGNGLGLATVREIVLEHGGALRVQSTPGLGTCFDIWLPSAAAADSAALTHVDAPERARREHGNGETVLVVEPDRERLLRHEEVLAALGYEPVGFSDAVTATAACVESPDRFDAALLCCPPDQFNVRLPIILSTATARELQAPALAGNNIAAIIGQPPTMAELAASLARCLRPVLPP